MISLALGVIVVLDTLEFDVFTTFSISDTISLINLTLMDMSSCDWTPEAVVTDNSGILVLSSDILLLFF